MSFLDEKRAARRTLHETLARPALYLPVDDSDAVPVTVRLHYRYDQAGGLSGGFDYAETQQQDPALIFLRSELAMPEVRAVVSIEAGLAYRIDNVLPPDDITIKAEVTPLLASETAGLPTPDDPTPETVRVTEETAGAGTSVRVTED